MPPALPLQVLDLFPTDALLITMLDLSPTGIVLCAPVHDAAGTLVDVALAYLNPAAQRLLHLACCTCRRGPAPPSHSILRVAAPTGAGRLCTMRF